MCSCTRVKKSFVSSSPEDLEDEDDEQNNFCQKFHLSFDEMADALKVHFYATLIIEIFCCKLYEDFDFTLK
jgi:hypothetical protein